MNTSSISSNHTSRRRFQQSKMTIALLLGGSLEAAIFSLMYGWMIYFEHIIQPYIKEKIAASKLPPSSKAIVILDCWSVHRSEEFRMKIRTKYRNIELLFIPPNCTSKLQVADV